jgi:aldose 1-epimerase
MTQPPSGTQYEIGLGDAHAVVTEVGATLRSFTVGGYDVIDGFPVEETSSAGRGQVLAPWPNRLQDGTYRFDGRRASAALDEPERGNAIHGLVRWLPWRAVLRTRASVALECVVHPQPAYPWRLHLRVAYRLSADALTVVTVATNRSDEPAPFGIGFHPYLTVGTAPVDDACLTIPAERRLITDERGLPTGIEDVTGTGFDFTEARTIGAVRMDTAFTDLRPDETGRCAVVLEGEDGGRRVTLWMDPAYTHVMVYTGDTLEPAWRRRRGIAIEPMTCPPNAFRSGIDVIRLEPAATWNGDWGIRA